MSFFLDLGVLKEIKVVVALEDWEALENEIGEGEFSAIVSELANKIFMVAMNTLIKNKWVDELKDVAIGNADVAIEFSYGETEYDLYIELYPFGPRKEILIKMSIPNARVLENASKIARAIAEAILEYIRKTANKAKTPTR